MSSALRLRDYLLAGVTSAILLWAGFNVWFHFGENYRKALHSISVSPAHWQVVEGNGYATRESLTVTDPGRFGYAVAVGQLSEPVSYAQIEEIRVSFRARVDHHGLSLGVASSPNLTTASTFNVGRVDDATASVLASDLSPDPDDFSFIILEISGSSLPIPNLTDARLYRSRPGFWKLQALLIKGVVDFRPWTQRSVNYLESPSRVLRVSPALTVLVWAILAILLLAAWASARGLRLRVALSTMSVLLLGWLFLDVAWQITLSGRHVEAIDQYRGKSTLEKRAQEIDSGVHAFVQQLRSVVNDSSRPFVIFGDSNFTHLRARYFAVPQPSISYRGPPRPVWLARLRPGDILVALNLPASPVSIPLPIEDNGDLRRTRMNVDVSEMPGADSSLNERDGRPLPVWLLESPWLAPEPGVWRLQVELDSPERGGWVRLNLLARSDMRDDPRLLARREFFLHDGQSTVLSISFALTDGQQILFRLQQVETGDLIAGDAWLEPLENDQELELLSSNGEPPFLIARKLLATDVGLAWEIL